MLPNALDVEESEDGQQVTDIGVPMSHYDLQMAPKSADPLIFVIADSSSKFLPSAILEMTLHAQSCSLVRTSWALEHARSLHTEATRPVTSSALIGLKCFNRSVLKILVMYSSFI
jgi:hypothetical protein